MLKPLRALQAPIKAKYREHRTVCRDHLKAKGQVGEGITCKVETGRAIAEAGLSPRNRWDGSELCSGDMLPLKRWLPVQASR